MRANTRETARSTRKRCTQLKTKLSVHGQPPSEQEQKLFCLRQEVMLALTRQEAFSGLPSMILRSPTKMGVADYEDKNSRKGLSKPRCRGVKKGYGEILRASSNRLTGAQHLSVLGRLSGLAPRDNNEW